MGSCFFLSSPAELILGSRGDLEEAKNLAGEGPPPDSDPFDVTQFLTETVRPCLVSQRLICV